MNENRISIEISQADIDVINQAVQTLNDKLAPYLIALEAGDKQALAKMKDKSVPFVEKVLQYVDSNAEFVPAYLDMGEMKKDYQAFNVLNNWNAQAQLVNGQWGSTGTNSNNPAFSDTTVFPVWTNVVTSPDPCPVP